MAEQPLPFSVDRILAKEVPKLFQLADDMHAMASYMNDLRIVAILGTVVGIGSLICFLIVKYCKKKKSDQYDVCPQDEVDGAAGRGKYATSGHPSAFTPLHHQWPDRSKVADIESKLAIRLPEHTEAHVIRNGDKKLRQEKGDVANV